MMSDTSELPALPERPRAAHKGNFGVCAMIGGSVGMLGAMFLGARAALRSGVGLCRLGLPVEGLPSAPIAVPEATSFGLTSEEGAISVLALEDALAQCQRVHTVALGPGFSLRGSAEGFVQRFVAAIDKPLVLDADGINALDCQPELLRSRKAPTVLTPHPGEAARLLDWHNAAEVQGDRRRAAQELHARTGAIVVLKGMGTLVFDGETMFENSTGNPGMATGGSGDVLTGIPYGAAGAGHGALRGRPARGRGPRPRRGPRRGARQRDGADCRGSRPNLARSLAFAGRLVIPFPTPEIRRSPRCLRLAAALAGPSAGSGSCGGGWAVPAPRAARRSRPRRAARAGAARAVRLAREPGSSNARVGSRGRLPPAGCPTAGAR
jgi:hydroxyethylthiazole kinase-like uncharacterized protein yjeF